MKISKGRQKIYTSYKDITPDNIKDVLAEVMPKFWKVRREIIDLKEFEMGEQELLRSKPQTFTANDQIDITEIDNLAGYATDFHTAHFWGNPPTFIQRGENEEHKTDPRTDAKGISALNEHLNNKLGFRREFAQTGFSCEQTGVGYLYVNRTKPNVAKKYGKYFVISNLEPEYSFVAYYDGIEAKKVLGVTFSGTKVGKCRITAYTEDWRFDIDQIEDTFEKMRNDLGIIPIVEFTRFMDRTSCFEKCISSLKAHNTMASDFDNDYCQAVYAIWWINDAQLPQDDKGNDILPENGDFVATTSTDGKNPKVQALVPNIDRGSILASIKNSRSWNLAKMYVPTQNDISGGSSGVAESMASGWEVVETIANMKEVLASDSMHEVAEILVKAISFVPKDVLPLNDPLRKIHESDIDFHFDRKHNYDMATKANVIATLVNSGITPSHAIRVSNLFSDAQQVTLDSETTMKKIQESHFAKTTEGEGEKTTLQDLNDQNKNSPIIDNG